MFNAKQKTTEEESDSDWDSISGDAMPAPSSPEPTPRFQPAPPTGSTRTASVTKAKQGPKLSSLTNPISVDKSPRVSEGKSVSSPATHKLSQLYGKPGITSFTDRNLEQRPQREDSSASDLNASKSQKPAESSFGRREEIMVEMTDMSYEVNNPPYTDFQAATVSPNNRITGQTTKKKKSKVKTSYLANQNVNAEEGEGSWDDSDRENQEHVFGSQQQLTPTIRGSKDQGSHHKIRLTNSYEISSIPLQNDNNVKEPVVVHASESDVESHKLENNCCAIISQTNTAGYKYVFDHGHNQHLDVGSEWRDVRMNRVADSSEKWLKYFWKEFFGVLRLIIDFALIFVLELTTFVVRFVAIRFLLGLVVIVGDHLLKPLLTAVFNGLIQPLFAFLWNVLMACKNAVMPLLDLTREMVLQIATLLKAFRLFELTWKPNLRPQPFPQNLQVL